MVKRATFLQMFLVAAIFVILCAYGLAVAKDKLVLKYLPVDHDIEMIRQENNSKTNPLLVNQTNNTDTEQTVKNHIGCLRCREFDQPGGKQCPDCCLYGKNKTLIHCQNATDPACPYMGPVPFAVLGTGCPAGVTCNNAYTRPCGGCAGPCSKYPQPPPAPCFSTCCPESTRPKNTTQACVNIAPPMSVLDTWVCGQKNLPTPKACASLNPSVPSCQNFTNATAYVTTTLSNAECIAAGFANGTCSQYAVTPAYQTCLTSCKAYAELWEMKYYAYVNGTLGKAVCPAGNCTSGFEQNCNVARCKEKLDFSCGIYNATACVDMEDTYREMLLGNIADAFQEIDPHFRYKFVARSGEQYMLSWQILCDVKKGDQKYNLYTMVKVWEQGQEKAISEGGPGPVYQSIVHQKALGSTFYINAQTGMDVKKAGLKAGKAYVAKLYYFLPNDGETLLQVDISLMQMILYRTKN
jgi:hypothetical protein